MKMPGLVRRSPEPVKLTRVQKSLIKGAAAGLIGGIAATAARSLAARYYKPRPDGKPALLARQGNGREPNAAQKLASGKALHWGIGAAAGAAYGAVAEYYPAATARDGARFGMVLATLANESPLSNLGFRKSPDDQSVVERTSDVASHVVYGLVTETVRSRVRKMLR